MGKHMKQIERKINSLPSKTWYWLNLNEATLTWNAEGSRESVSLEPSVDEPFFLTVTGEDYAEKEIRIETEPGTFSEVLSRLTDCETVTQIYRTTGECHLHVHAVAAGQAELEAFLHETIDALPGLRAIHTNVILSRVKDVKGLRL